MGKILRLVLVKRPRWEFRVSESGASFGFSLI